MKNHEFYMREALNEAEKSIASGSYPFACVVVDNGGEIVCREHDRVDEYTDPTAHGEINAIRHLCKKLNIKNLSGFTFYTTSEPCPTCLSSLLKAKVNVVVFGTETEADASLPISAFELAERSTREIEIIGGILREECLKQRTKFFNK